MISRDALNARITKGLKDRARATGVTVDQVKDDLYHTRKANGIRSARKKPLQTLINTGETTDDEAEVDSTPPDDAHLFASPDHLVGETLLHAAERYSNRSLSRRLGNIPGTTTPIITASGIHARLTRAFNARSKQTCTPVDQLRTELARARASNGVRTAFTRRHPGSMEAVSRQVGQMVPQTRSGLAVSSPLAAATAEGEQREHTGETTEEDEDYESTTDVESLGDRNGRRASDINVAGDVPIREIDPEMLEAAHILLGIRYSVVTSPAHVTPETGPRVLDDVKMEDSWVGRSLSGGRKIMRSVGVEGINYPRKSLQGSQKLFLQPFLSRTFL